MICLVLISMQSSAQVESVTIQASGLTCSMCSNSIFKALQSLEFVDKVEPNIQNSTFLISFKPKAVIEFDQLKGKVEDAGFFVANFTVAMNFDQLAVTNDTHVTIGKSEFHFINAKSQILTGLKTFRLLDKGYVSAKEYKKNSSFTKKDCYKSGDEAGIRIFHVTI